MATTIQVSKKLVEELKKRRLYDKESYEEVLWNLLEDSMELSEETKRNIQKSIVEANSGKTFTHEEVKKRLGI